MAQRLIAWIDSLPLHQTVRTLGWFIPSVQIVHILSVTIVFGAVLLLSLRTYGLTAGDWSPAQWSQRFRPWLIGALVVLLLTGMALILGEPERTLTNRTFQVKMLMLIVAIGLSALLMRRVEHAPTSGATGLVERGAAGGILLLTVLIIFAGRWIAYT